MGSLDPAEPTEEGESLVIKVSKWGHNAKKPNAGSPSQPENVPGCSSEPAIQATNSTLGGRDRPTNNETVNHFSTN